MRRSLILLGFLQVVFCSFRGAAADFSLLRYRWYEVSTAHFNFYSCGDIGGVYKLAGRLEQFSRAYAQLAGAEAVASPPIVVLAFPDRQAMQPFLKIYDGKPASMSAFFQHGQDENLIVLSLPEPGAAEINLDVIFHEYTHFLFRRNDGLWPLWLKEGMAEVYSTFEISGHFARIANPIGHHLRLLAEQPMMPLADLFAVNSDSPEYNESQRQGLFYAESWLLTDFLMAGDNARLSARFGRFNTLLHQGQLPEQAFTNALQISLPQVQNQLQRYLDRGLFRPIDLSLTAKVSAPVPSTNRAVGTAEAYFRLGDELLRLQRQDDAEAFFNQARKLAPNSPMPLEGLGMLAQKRGQHAEALKYYSDAIARGSSHFLVYYLFADEKYRTYGDSEGRHARLGDQEAAEISNALGQSIAWMPDFAPAHELLGFFEMVQGDDLGAAAAQLERAIQLEPEDRSYLISLAQLQIQTRNPEAARQTLQPLLSPNVPPQLRAEAEKLITKLPAPEPGQ